MQGIALGIMISLLLMSLCMCLDHIFVPFINRRLSQLEQRVSDLEQKSLDPHSVDDTDNDKGRKDD